MRTRLNTYFGFLRYVLVTKIRPHIDAFLSGFNLEYKHEYYQGFNVGELGRLISLVREISILTIGKNTTYGQGFDNNSVQIVWF